MDVVKRVINFIRLLCFDEKDRLTIDDQCFVLEILYNCSIERAVELNSAQKFITYDKFLNSISSGNYF
jgi:hypothetical protein